jgi:hypothetical protein
MGGCVTFYSDPHGRTKVEFSKEDLCILEVYCDGQHYGIQGLMTMENIVHHGISWLYIGKATWRLRSRVDTSHEFISINHFELKFEYRMGFKTMV